MLGFHIRGSYKFQTKIGAIVSLVYIASLFGFLVLYLTKFFETDNPTILWNIYDADTYSHTKFAEEKLHFYFVPYNLATQTFMPYKMFMANFSIWVTNIQRDTTKPMNKGGLKFNPVSLVPCGSQDWWKTIDNPAGQKTISTFGICIDYKKVNVLAPSMAQSTNLIFTLYNCQSGYGVNCVNKLPAAALLNTFFVYQSTINIKQYQKPEKMISKQLDQVQADDTLKYWHLFKIEDTHLKTDKGSVMEDWKNEVFPVVNKDSSTVYMRGQDKIKGSVAWHGRAPSQDY